MDAARTIREAVDTVARLRQSAGAEPGLARALQAVKGLQSRRFAGTYPDLLADPTCAAAAQFFLDELYGLKDYRLRDEQFGRIAGAIETFFPAQVARTAAALASLHALTEELDLQMARIWQLQLPELGEAQRYALAWRELNRPRDRRAQLESVLALGADLVRLTRTPGLRTMLRMMRGPATAAGLAELQRFLEAGFDTFAGMARKPGAAEAFLAAVRDRESALMDRLDSPDLVASGTEVARTLGQAP